MIVCGGTRPNGRPCRNILGALHGGQFEMRHRGRHLLAPLPVTLWCEDCGATMRVDGPYGAVTLNAAPAASSDAVVARSA